MGGKHEYAARIVLATHGNDELFVVVVSDWRRASFPSYCLRARRRCFALLDSVSAEQVRDEFGQDETIVGIRLA
ncbi:hypothetical protein NL30_30085 [Burkholderia contaminans]|nr:hypothetical protein NL30_30085 [Burkholderia contaminans]